VPRVCLNHFFASKCQVFVLGISLLQPWHFEAKKLLRQTRGILKQRNDKDKYVAL
jgi:hypothetical protein